MKKSEEYWRNIKVDFLAKWGWEMKKFVAVILVAISVLFLLFFPSEGAADLVELFLKAYRIDGV